MIFDTMLRGATTVFPPRNVTNMLPHSFLRRVDRLALALGFAHSLVVTKLAVNPGLLIMLLLAAWGIGLVLMADWGLAAIERLVTPKLIAILLIAIFSVYAGPVCGRGIARFYVRQPIGTISQLVIPDLRRPVLIWDGAPIIKRGAYLLYRIKQSLLFYE